MRFGMGSLVLSLIDNSPGSRPCTGIPQPGYGRRYNPPDKELMSLESWYFA